MEAEPSRQAAVGGAHRGRGGPKQVVERLREPVAAAGELPGGHRRELSGAWGEPGRDRDATSGPAPGIEAATSTGSGPRRGRDHHHGRT